MPSLLISEHSDSISRSPQVTILGEKENLVKAILLIHHCINSRFKSNGSYVLDTRMSYGLVNEGTLRLNQFIQEREIPPIQNCGRLGGEFRYGATSF